MARRVLRLVIPNLMGMFAALIYGLTSALSAEFSSGSGVVIGSQGEILTNSHVVENCKSIIVKFPAQKSETAILVAHDQKNDLAVIRAKASFSVVAAFREGAPVRAGDVVVVLGYPLSGLLASTANLSVGNVSALAGIGDDTRYFQISAPVQPGNSGGPLLDASGHLVGIVTAKLDAARMARFTGDIPQNVNFALKGEVVRSFLDSNGIAYQLAHSDQRVSSADVGDIGRPFTIHIRCEKESSRPVTAPRAPQTPPSPSKPWLSIAAGIWRVDGRVHVAVGYSGARTSDWEARQRAIDACRDAGGRDCQSKGVWDSGCVYITTGTSSSRAGWGSGDTVAEAVRRCEGQGLTCKQPIGGCVE